MRRALPSSQASISRLYEKNENPSASALLARGTRTSHAVRIRGHPCPARAHPLRIVIRRAGQTSRGQKVPVGEGKCAAVLHTFRKRGSSPICDEPVRRAGGRKSQSERGNAPPSCTCFAKGVEPHLQSLFSGLGLYSCSTFEWSHCHHRSGVVSGGCCVGP